MSDEDNFSLHSFQAEEDNDQIDLFYKDLSMQFYAPIKESRKKVSLLLSGSTEPNSKPSRDTLPDVNRGIIYMSPQASYTSRPGSAKSNRQNSKSPVNLKNKLGNIKKTQGSPYKITPTTYHIQRKVPVQHATKLIKLLQSPYNNELRTQQNQKQAYIQKQLEMIRNLQLKELKEHYYK